jgi:putative heme iron utilization protein
MSIVTVAAFDPLNTRAAKQIKTLRKNQFFLFISNSPYEVRCRRGAPNTATPADKISPTKV